MPPADKRAGTLSRTSLQLATRFENRFDNLCVPGTTAEIPGKRLADFVRAGPGNPRKQIHGRKDHAWGANSALRAAVLKKRLLHRVQMLSSDSLDRENLGAVCVENGHQATVHQRAVDHHRTSTAFALAASFFRACEAELFAQHIQQPRHRMSFEDYGVPIYAALDRELCRADQA